MVRQGNHQLDYLGLESRQASYTGRISPAGRTGGRSLFQGAATQAQQRDK